MIVNNTTYYGRVKGMIQELIVTDAYNFTKDSIENTWSLQMKYCLQIMQSGYFFLFLLSASFVQFNHELWNKAIVQTLVICRAK